MSAVGSFINFLNNLLFTLSWPMPFVVITGSMALIAVLAYVLKHLTASGAVGAWLLGVSVLWILRFEGFFLFFVFYVSCNITGLFELLSGSDKIACKGIQRDLVQVFANGLVPVLMAFGFFFSTNNLFIVAFGAAVAEATADTWAGDFGKLWPYQPVSLKYFKPVEKGTSGAVSPLGCIASVAASGLIAFLWSVLFGLSSGWGVIMLCGFFGCTVDSFLGAYCQALYVDSDGQFTEKPTSELVRGVRWINNDLVNLISNLSATLLSFVLV